MFFINLHIAYFYMSNHVLHSVNQECFDFEKYNYKIEY